MNRLGVILLALLAFILPAGAQYQLTTTNKVVQMNYWYTSVNVVSTNLVVSGDGTQDPLGSPNGTFLPAAGVNGLPRWHQGYFDIYACIYSDDPVMIWALCVWNGTDSVPEGMRVDVYAEPLTASSFAGDYPAGGFGWSGTAHVALSVVTNSIATTNSIVVTNTAPQVLVTDAGYFRWK